ncbi:hypothetical protein POL68_37355 [Stigmatella sp. ncwal1]|uniref:Uncharacterized protein n=1 Tax=Stigmatella ashevillensis TaxID=2995309 RepID=A0ABT5DKJ9_9BACT|nr:hypothetical protein [Stigmatella ashevillena]MDC0714192.1 hypothetical protein [Stigmatella ashevillena]
MPAFDFPTLKEVERLVADAEPGWQPVLCRSRSGQDNLNAVSESLRRATKS